MQATVRVEIPSDIAMLSVVEPVCDQLSHRSGLDADAASDVALAVRETVANAITHGNQEGSAHRVTVAFSAAADPARVEVTVTDQGEGFTLEDVPDPRAAHNLLKANGRGLLFIRALMDEVYVSRSQAGGCEVRVIKYV